MITKDNLRQLLEDVLGFQKNVGYKRDIVEKSYGEDTLLTVDFTNEKIIYPAGIKIERDTTINFSKNENFVVLECVCALMGKGYKPEQIVLEPKTPGGREDSYFYGDILVHDNDNVPYLLIECKNAGGYFDSAWKDTLQDGGQLFRYYNSYRKAQYLCLYSSDFVDGKVKREYKLIKMTDNEERLDDSDALSYAKVAAENGSYEDFFHVWKETYEGDAMERGAFEENVPPFGIGGNLKYTAGNDLTPVDSEAIKKKYNEFAVILRQHNVGSHENAFDKLVNLFLAKVVDETNNPNDLHFYWKGASYDDDFSLQDRLQRLYRDGMRKFLGEEVTYIENSEIDKAFRWVKNDLDATKRKIKDYFRQLKFFSDNDFSFISVHNKDLFKQNAQVLRKVVKMLQGIRLRVSEKHQNQLLGDLFEGFLTKGVKQSEGQYFTPMPIVRFIVSALPLEQIIRDSPDAPYAIDYACGAGHFLSEYDFRIKEFAKKYHPDIPLSDYYAHTIGIEKEYRLSKVSKVSAFMYGHDETNIIYADALSQIKDVDDGKFSVLVTNPPYAVKGFLETLQEKERKLYSLYNRHINLDKNNAIETFFMERAAQLLKAGGVAGIILPVSVLNKEGIYTHAREIILQNFDIVALAKFEKNTFGKTATSTVTMFLRRKETNTPEALHYRGRVESWFSGEHEADKAYQDNALIDAYCRHVGYGNDDYRQFLVGEMPDGFKQTEVVQGYHDSFVSNKNNAMNGVCEEAKKIRAKFKARKAKAAFGRLSVEEQSHIEERAFYAFVKEIEKDKLYYFILAYSQPCPVVIVNMPSGTTDGKKFLGYEWSETKGNEGIKYLHVSKSRTANHEETDEDDGNAEDDDTIQQIRGINGIVTPLFNPNDLNDPNKINTIIRSNFLGEDVDIPKNLTPFVSLARLVDVLDFSHTAFKKELRTNNIFKTANRYIWNTLLLDKLLVPIEGATTKLKGDEIGNFGQWPVVSQQSDKLINGYADSESPIKDVPLILFGDHTCVFKWIDFPFLRGADGTQLLKVKADGNCLLKYLYYYLCSISIENAGKYERHFKYLKQTLIPLPPLSVQQKIVDECTAIDQQFEAIQIRIREIKDEIGRIQANVTGEARRLKDVASFVTNRVPYQDINPDSYVSTDNMLPDCEGVAPYNGVPDTKVVIEYRKGDILLSNIRPYLKKLWLADRNGGCSPDVLVMRSTDGGPVDSAFIYYMLRQDSFFAYIMEDVKGLKMPRGKKEHIERFQLRIPSIAEQHRLANQFLDYDVELSSLKAEQQSMPLRKQAILDKYLK